MNRKNKTKDSLNNELDRMRRKHERIERCRMELDRVRQKYDKLLESAPDAMVFVDSQGKIIYLNAQIEKLFDYTESDLIGCDIEILIPERYRVRHRAHLERYFSQPRPRPMGMNLEIYGLKKDGTEFPLDISLSPLQADGELIAVGALRDITEAKRVRDQIERNYHIQRVIGGILKISLEPIPLDQQLDGMLELILTVPGLSVDSKGLIFLAEDGQQALHLRAHRGFPSLEVVPCKEVHAGMCLCGEAVSGCRMVFAECLDDRHQMNKAAQFPHGHYCVPIASGDDVLGLINVYVRGGHRHAPEEVGFLTAAANAIAGVIVRHRADSEKLGLQEQLRLAEKLAALGRIAANLADEIRNPLTAVGGFARRLAHRAPAGTEEGEYAASIASEVGRLEGILKGVLSYTRTAGPRKETCDVREIADQAISRFEERCASSSVRVVRSYGEVSGIEMDKLQVREALEHLISNALDAMPGGGELTVSTSTDAIKEKQCVAVRVRDTGGGISEDTLAMIFEPFFTTKHSLRAVGLGLSIARKIAEEHGGTIAVESAAGAGSTFTLYFPCEVAG